MWLGSAIHEESFFGGNPFEGPGWTGETAPGTISLAHVLRGSCARGSFGQTRFFLNKKYLVELFLKDLSPKGFNDMSYLIK